MYVRNHACRHGAVHVYANATLQNHASRKGASTEISSTRGDPTLSRSQAMSWERWSLLRWINAVHWLIAKVFVRITTAHRTPDTAAYEHHYRYLGYL